MGVESLNIKGFRGKAEGGDGRYGLKILKGIVSLGFKCQTKAMEALTLPGKAWKEETHSPA